jgi:NitT/TauT family transport system ATP-binding protein
MVTHDIAEAVSMSDRVIVLTRRPASVKSVYAIEYASGRGTPLQCREKDEFRKYFNQIWRDIDVHI